MASRTLILCDMDEKHEGAETIVYSLDGEYLEVDLCAAGAAKLRKALEPFDAVARPVSARDAVKGNGQSWDPAAVRLWAQRNGIAVADKGRVPADVITKWRASLQTA